jgi:dienelactone hydrolase
MLRVIGALFALSIVVGCSSKEDPPANNNPTDSGTTTETGDSGVDQHPAVILPCTDTEDAVYGDPGMLPADKGAIMKCSSGERYTKEALEARARMNGYKGKPFTSGAKVYRILFRTERGDAKGTAAYSSAIVYLPDTPRAAKSPLLVASHGSRGQAAKCAATRLLPDGEYVRSDFENQTLPLVGAGLPVIASDGPGYTNFGAPGNPASVYNSAADLGKAQMDTTRAFRKLAPSLINDDVVLYGHSQGGHTVLATLALADSYPAQGTIKAAVVYAPLWMPQRTWGAVLYLPTIFTFDAYLAANAISIWYHYTHAELLDGPGKGAELFKPEKREAIKKFVNEQCWAADYPNLKALGSNASDIFEPALASAVGEAAATGTPCPTTDPEKTVCEKWMKRYLDDRPHLTGSAAKVPILFLYGNKDPSVPADRVACARDRLKADMANVTWCIEPEDTHSSILHNRASYSIDWLLAKTLGTADPGACALGEMGISAACNPTPPND